MPIYDRRCNLCESVIIDCIEPINTNSPICTCGGTMDRVWLPGSNPTVIQDSIEGGIEIRHGICNPDGSPRKYYSKSEIARAAKEKGLVNYVEHVPTPGSDKSTITSKQAIPIDLKAAEELVRRVYGSNT